MNKHINHCKHNEDFLSQLSVLCPKSFFDWKTTASFYCGTHLIRGFALYKEEEITGERHSDVFDYLERKVGAKSKPLKAFNIMYRNSRDCRYNGFAERENFERFSEIKLNESRTHYGILKTYFISQGLKIEEVQPA
jgi:hypothetical protein